MRLIDIMMDCLQADLKKLRNRSIVGYFALNGTLLYIFYLMQKYANSLQIGGDNGDSVEPVGRFTYYIFTMASNVSNIKVAKLNCSRGLSLQTI